MPWLLGSVESKGSMAVGSMPLSVSHMGSSGGMTKSSAPVACSVSSVSKG